MDGWLGDVGRGAGGVRTSARRMEQERAQLSSSNPLDWLVSPFQGLMNSGSSLAGNLPDSTAWGVSSGRAGMAAGQQSLGNADWWGAGLSGLISPQVSQRNDQQVVAANRSSQGSEGRRCGRNHFTESSHVFRSTFGSTHSWGSDLRRER